MHKKQTKPERARQVLDFFDWAYQNGGKLAESLDYVPMPADAWSSSSKTAGSKSVKGPDGKPVWIGPAS